MSYVIAGHSIINKNTPTTVIPPDTYLLLHAKCLHFAKNTHNKMFSPILSNNKLLRNFFTQHPVGLFKPGNTVQNVTIQVRGNVRGNRSLVHGVIKLPLPKGANLSNKTKNVIYNIQPLSKGGNTFQGNVKLSNVLRGRPGYYLGNFCRIATGVHYDPKGNMLAIGSGSNVQIVHLNNQSVRNFFKNYNGPNMNHVLAAFKHEKPEVTKKKVQEFLKSLRNRVVHQ